MGESSESDDILEPPAVIHTYARKHRRSTSSSRNTLENTVSQAAATSLPIATTCKVDNDFDVPAPAPATPDIVTRKRMGKCEDVSKEPCLTEYDQAEIKQFTDYCQDSKKKTCRRSLNLDMKNPQGKVQNDVLFEETNEHDDAKDVGCRRSLRIYQKLKKSGYSSLPNEKLRVQNKRVMKSLEGPEKSSPPKIRKQSVACIRGISMKTHDFKCNEQQRERQVIEKESLHRQIHSFLSCINKIQGERKFSQWKGSVMDSIGGAYLAQNTNDTLSSSAFMSLAAKFPRESKKAVLDVKENKTHAAMSRNSERQRIKKKHDPVLLNVLKDCYSKYLSEKKTFKMPDAIDWDSVRMAKVADISKAIQIRGMNNHLAGRIKNCVEKLVTNFGSTDMEWIRDVPSHKAKEYLLSIYGLGLKSVECICLLTLRHKAFPIDTNAGRVAVRLGWVPLEKLAKGEEFHLLKEYPKEDSIQMYLWPHLSDLDFPILYELHCHMITFGKIFCTERNPNCYECPMGGGCKYYACIQASNISCTHPRKSTRVLEMDLEDFGLTRWKEDVSMNIQFKVGEGSRSMLDQTSEMASIREVKKRNAASLRTEHQVYILPDGHDLLAELELRKLDDPCPYLLAVSTPESVEKDEEDAVYGTFLIPVRTATREIFPLNGTFFQPNEVFADEESSEVPVKVGKASLANLLCTTLYCGSNISAICRGMTNVQVKNCFKSGYVCFRGFNKKTREPKPLPPRFHIPAGKSTT